MSTFPRGTIMQWSTDGLTNSTKVRITDHGRDSLVATSTRIESKARTWEGTLRKNVVATKYAYSCNWTFVPTLMSKLADYDSSNPTLIIAPMLLSHKKSERLRDRRKKNNN